MQLSEIHERTHLPLARLRYVLDNEIVKGLDRASEGRGTPRDFTPSDSVLLALAAALLENGLGAPFVRGFIERLLHDKSASKLAVAPFQGEVQMLQIAGEFYGRMLTTLNLLTNPPRWLDSRTRAFLDPSYRPLTFVSVDIAELRKRLFGD